MSLLREIQDAAVEATTPLTVVLRKCMILAARLGHEPFKKWVEEELNGYPPDADLPAYRHIAGLTSIGNFAGGLGVMLRNVPLPLAPVPADLRDKYQNAEFREGVAKLADMAKPPEDGGQLIARWSADLISQVAYNYFLITRLAVATDQLLDSQDPREALLVIHVLLKDAGGPRRFWSFP